MFSPPQNLTCAAVNFLYFTVVSGNYVFADIGIIGDDYTLLLELTYMFIENEFLLYSWQQTTLFIILLFIEQRRQVIAVKTRNSQKNMYSNGRSETAVFHEISLRIRWYFSQVSVIKAFLCACTSKSSAHPSLKLQTVNWGTINIMIYKFDHGQTNSLRVIIKISFGVEKCWSYINYCFSCNFLNRMHIQLPNLRHFQYVTNKLWKFRTNHTNTLFVVWVWVN